MTSENEMFVEKTLLNKLKSLKGFASMFLLACLLGSNTCPPSPKVRIAPPDSVALLLHFILTLLFIF